MNLHALATSLLTLISLNAVAQQLKPYTSSFIGRMGVDTVLVETYTMVNNHLYGRAFTRVPEDYIADFTIHFYNDGSIREFNVNAMNPKNSSIPFDATSGAFEYRLNMNCQNDTCTYTNSMPGVAGEKVYHHAASTMDFVGGWVPLISLMEWNCMRLVESDAKSLPLKMINHNIGVYDIGVSYKDRDTVLFGGPFLEYTRIKIDNHGRIQRVNGTGTPWNYQVTKHNPIDIDAVARRMSKTPGIGIPSRTENVVATIHDSKVTINYGRPAKRGRRIFGGVVPYDSLWRTGANGATTITIDHDIRIGGHKVPKGTYSIYTIPTPSQWTMILNTDTQQWPTDPDRSKDLVQFVIPVTETSSVEEIFTIALKETRKGGQIVLMWDRTEVSVDFQVMK